MKKYPAYKDSGIEWIGEIPEDWEVNRLQTIGVFSASGIDKKISPDEPLVSMVNYMDIYGNPSKEISRNRPLMQVSCATDKIISCNLKKGDLVFTPSSETKEDIGLSALINEDLENTVFSYHTLRLRFEKEIYHRYKKYLCNNHFVLNQFSRQSKGTTRQILVRDDFRNIRVITPTLPEQQAIADFLDKKTELIDGLIEKKKRQIELLKEQRQAVINQAVTKGLDPTVEMKGSGIEWLGNIPKHWDTKKLRYVFSMNTGLSVTKEELQESGIPCVNYGDIHTRYGFDLDLSRDNLKYVDEKYLDEKQSALATENDFIFCDTSEDIEGSGNCVYISKLNDNQIFAGSHTIIAKPIIEVNSRYLAYLFKAESWRTQIRSIVYGIKVYSITQKILKDTFTLLPPFTEQQQISDYLDHFTKNIDKSISKAEKQIELLQEYRTALITEAVTGKIDVREAV